MASGTINGSFSGPSSTDHARPQITWSSTTSVSGNYSNVTATLRFRKWQYWNSWNLNGHSVTITINGNSDSANRTFDLRSSNNYVVWSRTVKVNHNSDGSKTIKIGASGNTGVSLGTYNFSGDANLGTIPRASTLSAFSFNANLKNGVENKINYTVDRKSGSFRHQIQLRDGTTTVRTWDNIDSNGKSTLTLTASEVNTLLNRMSSLTTKSYTLRVATRSGSGGSWIGSAVSRNATATVHDDVKPNASGISVSISGNGHDDSIGKYVQGITRVYGSLSGSAGYGASISSRSFVVRRDSGSADSQTVNSASGTTDRAVALSGTYEAIGTIRDSRGRTNTARTTFTVDAYSAPVVTAFSATRDSDESTKVNILRAGRHSALSGSNKLTVSVQRRRGSGAWSNVVSDATMSGNTFTNTVESTGNNISLSYEFRVYIKDQFGRDAEVRTTVSTQRVVLDIHKNEGVGIGKIHERGVLDVDGGAYFAGPVHLDEIVSNHAGHEADLNTLTKTGFYHVGSQAKNTPANAWGLLYVNAGRTSGGMNVSQIYHPRGGVSGFSERGTPMYSRVMSDNVWYDWNIIGSNSGLTSIWSGMVYLNSSHTVTPSKSLSNCQNGWLLQWSGYQGGKVENTNFSYTFIPKQHGGLHSSSGVHQLIGMYNYSMKTKYMYVHNDRIVGNANNNSDGIVLRRIFAC